MLTKTIASAAAAAALILFSAGATANTVLTGSFEGIASGSRFDGLSPNAVDFDGEVVTGTFLIDLSAPPYDTIDGPNRTESVYPSSSVNLTFIAHGQVVDFGGPSSSGSVELDIGSGAPLLLIEGDAQNPYHNSFLALSGPLFDGLDIGTLRAADVDLSRSEAGFFQSRAFGASVTLTSVTFTSAVPEPATVSLLGMGLFAVAGVAWRRSRREPRKPAG